MPRFYHLMHFKRILMSWVTLWCLSSCLVIQWRSECDDNKKDIADNDDGITGWQTWTSSDRSGRGEQEMSDTSSDIWHDTRQTGGGAPVVNVITSQAWYEGGRGFEWDLFNTRIDPSLHNDKIFHWVLSSTKSDTPSCSVKPSLFLPGGRSSEMVKPT